MFAKKKHMDSKGACCPSARKQHQKHSRKPTKERTNFQPPPVLHKYLTSAQLTADKALLYKLNSILAGNVCAAHQQFIEAQLDADREERVRCYFALGSRGGWDQGRVIEKELIATIQNRHPLHFESRAVMHHEGQPASIMRRHLHRTQAYHNKLTARHKSALLTHNPRVYRKQLPTIVSERQRESPDKLNTSESVELNNLAECIREMLSKQAKYEHCKETPCQGSWLHPAQPTQLLDCDWSAIETGGRTELPVISALRQPPNREAEENYGLDELRRKFEENQQFKMSGSTIISKHKSSLGHKRNPTEALQRQSVYDPLTPHQYGARSAFGSSQNIQLGSPKGRKKGHSRHSSSKDEPYQLHFAKKKTAKTPKGLKENKNNRQTKEGKSKSRTMRVSKSKSRDKEVKTVRGVCK